MNPGLKQLLWASAFLSLAGTTGCALAGGLAETPAASDSFTIKLIGFNDFHGYTDPPGGTITAPNPAGGTVKLPTGGAAYFASMVKQLRASNPNSALLASGDLIGASPLNSALFHDEATIESLNRMGVDFSSVGNHEFDKGLAELRRMQDGGCYAQGVTGVDTCIIDGKFDGASFQYLAANVVDHKTGKTIFPAYGIKTFKDKNRSYRLAFIGLVLKATPTIVSPTGVAGLDFLDEATTVNKLLPKLKAQGADAIVVLIHQGGFTTGLFNDSSCPGLTGDILPIVSALDPAVDLVISGHTHQAYVCHQTANDGKKDIVLTSAGFYGRFVTDIDLGFERRLNGRLAHGLSTISAQNLAVVNDRAVNPLPTAYPTLVADAEQAALINRYDALAAPLTNKVVGSIGADITRTQNAAGESALGDVIADAQLAQTTDPSLGGAVAALMNPGGIRADLLFAQISGGEQAGQVTYGEAFTVQPFYNTLVTLSLTGAQLKTVLEQQWVGQTAPRFLQVSKGFSYSWDNSQPDGSKIVPGSIAINGVPVVDSQSYRVTVNNFLAGGGDNFVELKNGTSPLGGALDIDALTAFLGANAPVAPGPQNRVQRIN